MFTSTFRLEYGAKVSLSAGITSSRSSGILASSEQAVERNPNNKPVATALVSKVRTPLTQLAFPVQRSSRRPENPLYSSETARLRIACAPSSAVNISGRACSGHRRASTVITCQNALKRQVATISARE
jgi:hypothetical protein